MNNRISELITQFDARPVFLPIKKKELEHTIKVLFSLLFPVSDTNAQDCKATLIAVYHTLYDNISKLTTPEKAEATIETFFGKLNDIRVRLYADAETFLESDPAAKSLEEVILTYPGFFALAVHRIAHEFYKMNIPLIPRLFSEYAHAKVGVDIHPGAQIGNNFFLDHGTGTVIGETCIIGNNVKIYQGVTLGALHITKSMSKTKRHPTVEDNVVIYAGATILGGETVIGHDSTIGGNVWLTHGLPPYSLAYYSSEMKIKTVKNFIEPLNYVI
jgi:serine O-acetyltransferase